MANICLDQGMSSGSITAEIARKLRQAIVRLEIPPGAMLSEQTISREIGVSRQPVREAFIKLAGAQLVTVVPQRGTRVAGISRRRVGDSHFIRDAIEGAIAREAAERVDAKTRDLLDDNLQRQGEAASSGDLATLFDLDRAFHDLLTGTARRWGLWEPLEDLRTHVDRARWLTTIRLPEIDVIVRQHEAVFVAVCKQDAARAGDAMRTHIAAHLQEVNKAAQDRPDLFDH